jgi:translation initiation factor IF-2|tara:strand:- start:231 stop:473 length:243 start_codon:yes stop_codon:yes gene_type:complete
MWFWLIKSITGSIIGNASAEWFKKTKLGVWFFNKVDRLYNWAAERYNIKVLTEEEKKMAKFPMLQKRLNDIEKQLKEIKK